MSFSKSSSSLFLVLIQSLLVLSVEENSERPHFPPENSGEFKNAPFQSLFKFGDYSDIEKSIQDDLRRMSEIMDGEDFPFRKFDPVAHFDTEKLTTNSPLNDMEIGVDSPQINNTKSSEEKLNFPNEPLITIEKLFKTLEDLTKPSEMSPSSDFEETPFIIVRTMDVDPSLSGKLGGDFDRFRELFPAKVEIIPEDEENMETLEESKILGFLDNMFDRMGKVFDKFQDTILTQINTTEPTPRLNIEIEDHGFVYNIPPNALIDTTNPGIVNISWNADKSSSLNNSLCMKVSRDNDGKVLFQHVHLKIQRDNITHEYDLKTPISMNIDGANAKIKVTEGVQVNFPNSESLNVIIERSQESYPNHWVLFTLALLGLIVALFIMLLSYIVIHTKNHQYYPDKDNFSKQPIA